MKSNGSTETASNQEVKSAMTARLAVEWQLEIAPQRCQPGFAKVPLLMVNWCTIERSRPEDIILGIN